MLKHLSTLDSGLVLIVFAVFDRLTAQPSFTVFVLMAVLSFFISVIAALMGMAGKTQVIHGATAKLEGNELQGMKWNIGVAMGGFLSGTFWLLLFVALNL